MNAIVVLAAGPSSRMGILKTGLPFKGKTLLRHALEEALGTGAPVIVVTGADPDTAETNRKEDRLGFVRNEHWETGMASSVRTGVAAVLKAYPGVAHITLMVADQPFISSKLLIDLISKKEASGKGIIGCRYADTVGTPVLFDKKYFPGLLALKGQQGAKKLLQQFAADLATVDFPEGGIDIDTPDDYERLLES